MPEYTADLNTTLTQSQFCRLEPRGQLHCIQVRHPHFSADILTQGAQLLSFTPTGEDNWIWLSETAEFKTGVSVRGGIPVCWPWFGDLGKNPAEVKNLCANETAPAHGLVRGVEWQLDALEETASSVTMTLEYHQKPSSLWEAEAELKLTISMTGERLSLALTTTAGATPLAITQALHTYFPVKDIHKTRVVGLEGCRYTDALDNWTTRTQRGPIVFTEETDRIYQSPAHISLISEGRNMLLTSNSESAIVWNPWVDKAARLSQFPDDAWQRMFCVETANALDDWIQIAPGHSHTLTMTLSKTSPE